MYTCYSLGLIDDAFLIAELLELWGDRISDTYFRKDLYLFKHKIIHMQYIIVMKQKYEGM
jgi:hypothetical protein